MHSITATAILVAALCLGFACAACESCTPKQQSVQTAQAEAKPSTPPTARLYFVSDLAGQIEPCGCVKDQPGGLDHLAATVKADSMGQEPVLFVVGATRAKTSFSLMTPAEQPQRGREFVMIDRALQSMGLRFELTPESDKRAGPTISATSGVSDLDASESDAVFSVGKSLLRVGALRTVAGLDESAQEARLREALNKPRKEGADFWVLLSTLGRGASKRLAERLPEIGIVVVGRDLMVQDENTDGFAPESMGNTWILEPANHGQQVAVVDVWSGRGSALRVAARTLDVRESAGSDPNVLSLMREMDRSSNDANAKQFASVLPAKASPGQASYVGVKVCGTCHSEALKVWEGTAHSHAYATLEAKHKNFNLDCVSCHVAGYDKPGGSNVTHVEGLKNVQCENCHGPGSKHAASPSTVAIPLAHPGEDTCTSCHHTPHVKSFDFNLMLPRVLGPGHGQPEVPHPG